MQIIKTKRGKEVETLMRDQKSCSPSETLELTSVCVMTFSADLEMNWRYSARHDSLKLIDCRTFLNSSRTQTLVSWQSLESEEKVKENGNYNRIYLDYTARMRQSLYYLRGCLSPFDWTDWLFSRLKMAGFSLSIIDWGHLWTPIHREKCPLWPYLLPLEILFIKFWTPSNFFVPNNNHSKNKF